MGAWFVVGLAALGMAVIVWRAVHAERAHRQFIKDVEYYEEGAKCLDTWLKANSPCDGSMRENPQFTRILAEANSRLGLLHIWHPGVFSEKAIAASEIPRDDVVVYPQFGVGCG